MKLLELADEIEGTGLSSILNIAQQSANDSREYLGGNPGRPVGRSAFISECMRAEEASIASRYNIHVVTDVRKTVAVILDRRPGALHKYLMATDREGIEYMLSMPVAWIRHHRNILERLEAASGRKLEVSGGGFIMWVGQLLVYGLSLEFGPGDHQRARHEFGKAVATEPLPFG